jgi:parallel beta-helix repeat protein
LTRSWQGCVRAQPGLASAIGKRSAIACAGLIAAFLTGCATGETGSPSIVIEAGADNVVAENEVSGGFIGPDPAGDREGDGIFVGAFTAGTLLRNNVAFRNRGGIEVDATATRLRDNFARDNDAVAGVTDLGGNQASLNGNPLQCRNVVCE